jgi:hypothetical protein
MLIYRMRLAASGALVAVKRRAVETANKVKPPCKYGLSIQTHYSSQLERI